jgi:hypothetical protein
MRAPSSINRKAIEIVGAAAPPVRANGAGFARVFVAFKVLPAATSSLESAA